MEVQGISVCKFDDKTFLGVHKTHNVYLCDGKYGDYLRYMDKNFSIPAWAKMENLKEPCGITHAVKIIEWKMKNPMVPRGEAGCKKIDIRSGERQRNQENAGASSDAFDISENECEWYTKNDCIGIHEILTQVI